MEIKNSPNLKYDKHPALPGPCEGDEPNDPKCCVIEAFERVDDKINLYFKNGSQASLRAVNLEGGREIDSIEIRLGECLGRSYEEFLNLDFKEP